LSVAGFHRSATELAVTEPAVSPVTALGGVVSGTVGTPSHGRPSSVQFRGATNSPLYSPWKPISTEPPKGTWRVHSSSVRT
jgi:hypothetical protein